MIVYFNFYTQFYRLKKKDEKDKKVSIFFGLLEGIVGMVMESMFQWEVNEKFEKMLVCRSFCSESFK